MAAYRQHLGCRVGQAHLAARAVLNVERKISAPIVAVTDEGAPRRVLRNDLNRVDIDAIVCKPPQVQPPKVVVADAADDPARLAKFGDLVDEDRWCAARERPD